MHISEHVQLLMSLRQERNDLILKFLDTPVGEARDILQKIMELDDKILDELTHP